MVERTFSWLDWFRCLSRNYEESTEVAEEMIDFFKGSGRGFAPEPLEFCSRVFIETTAGGR